MAIEHGKLIVLEGLDGAGKGTIVAALREHFKNRKDFLFTHEPGGTPLGEDVRKILLDKRYSKMHVKTDILLHFAYRPEHYKNIIWPALEKGINVVMDRCDISTFAFEVYGRNRADLFNETMRLCAWVRDLPDDYIKSGQHIFDKIIFLDLDPEISLSRITKSRGVSSLDRYEVQGFDFHKRVYSGYHELREDKLFGPWSVVNANQKPEDVAKQVIGIVESTIKSRAL